MLIFVAAVDYKNIFYNENFQIYGNLKEHIILCPSSMDMHLCIRRMLVYYGLAISLGQAKLIISFSSYVQEFPQAGGWLFILLFVMNVIKYHHEFH